MKIAEHTSLASYTTFGIGGVARFFIEAETEDDVRSAVVFAREQSLPLLVLGRGSNLLVPDAPLEAVVVKVSLGGIDAQRTDEYVSVTAGAGVLWDDVVDTASEEGVFGIENLAGIPGSVGGAVVQNIGAYGTELSSVFFSAESIDSTTGVSKTITHGEGAFSYRTSFFKTHPEHIILRVTLRLSRAKSAFTEYPDFTALKERGVPLTTPGEIARAVRSIRAAKFPDISKEGTAGSFFKNPILDPETVRELQQKFPGLPSYPYEGNMKIPLAWILDRVLGLKGHVRGRVRLFERQPLVLVAEKGASAEEVELLAQEVAKKVHEHTGVMIEREVETFGAKK
jgi:UDP-N-acetylmuramate dehydrogenase